MASWVLKASQLAFRAYFSWVFFSLSFQIPLFSHSSPLLVLVWLAVVYLPKVGIMCFILEILPISILEKGL
jgi:hypothetical protein